jgi:SNF2 family DNA or RNA helicase
MLLTGTPMLNNADELWPLLRRIDPSRFPKYWSFVNRYCVMGGYNDKQVVGTKNQSELIGVLGEVMIRRVKKDVLTLPEPYRIQVKVSLTDYQQALYDEANEELRLGDMDFENALTKFLRLKQICTTPRAIDATFADDSEKMDRTIDVIDELCSKGEKVVVFTQFRGALSSVVERCIAGIPYVPIFQLHGDVPANLRQGVVKDWGAIPGPAVIVCMLQVAGVGLNMTASRSCIFVDKLFVPGLNQQAIDRLHRIGQSETQPVQVYEMIARGTIEDRIEQILRAKAKLFGEIVEGSVSMRKLMEELMRSELEESMR